VGEPVDPRELAAKMRRHDHYRAIFTVFSETSTGIENDIEAIGKLVAPRNPCSSSTGSVASGRCRFTPMHGAWTALVVGSQLIAPDDT